MYIYSTLGLTHTAGSIVILIWSHVYVAVGWLLMRLSNWFCWRQLHSAVHSVQVQLNVELFIAMSHLAEQYHGKHTCSFHKCHICCLTMKYESAHETVMVVLNRYTRASNTPLL